MCVEKIEGIVKEKPMATKKKILYIVEAMGGGVFTYIVDALVLLLEQKTPLKYIPLCFPAHFSNII